MLSRRNIIRFWIPAILWMAVIFTMSTDLMSGHNTGGVLSRLLQWIYPHFTDHQFEMLHHVIRKGAHMTEYGFLSMLLWRAIHHSKNTNPGGWSWRWRDAGWSWLVAAMFASTDEFHQRFVHSRVASVGDVLFDCTGALLGLVTIWLVGKRRKQW